jgi:hypothetical protein
MFVHRYYLTGLSIERITKGVIDNGPSLKGKVIQVTVWILLILNLVTPVMLAVSSYFQYALTRFSKTEPQKWNETRSIFFLLQALLWCINVVILFEAIRSIRNALLRIN